ncbi:putative reverse transcriptase domain-containing protein [Tanacetum coccineum]
MDDLARGNNNVSDTLGDSPIASKSLEHKLGTSHVLNSGEVHKDDGANGKLNKDGVDSRIHINSGPTFLGPTSYDKFVTGEPSRKSISSKDSLDAMLDNGPWFIHNNPLILNKWDPNVNLLKKDVGSILVWVKLHGVPMTAFSEDGLSVIAINIGTPLVRNSYTSDMCMQSWGRSSYARAMIDLRADEESKDSIMVAMPKLVVAMRNFLVFFDELSWRTSCDDACCFFSLSCLVRWLLQDRLGYLLEWEM